MGVAPNGRRRDGARHQVLRERHGAERRNRRASRASTTRYYLSLDPVKNAGDTLLTGTRSVPTLAVGAVNSGTATVTIPDNAPLGAYYVLACADDRAVVVETRRGEQLRGSAAVLTVTRPDLVASAVSNPPATAARGSKFSVTDSAQNVGAVRVRIVEGALLPVAECRQERRRPASRSGAQRPGARGGRGPLGDRRGDDPLGDPGEHLLRPGLRRRDERGGGDQRATTAGPPALR